LPHQLNEVFLPAPKLKTSVTMRPEMATPTERPVGECCELGFDEGCRVVKQKGVKGREGRD